MEPGFSVRGVVERMGVVTEIDSELTRHPSIVRLPVTRPRVTDRRAFLVDAPRPYERISVHENSGKNLLRGLNERVFYTDNLRNPPIQPKSGAFLNLGPFMRSVRAFPCPRMSDDDFLGTFQGKKRARYEAAQSSLLTKPLCVSDAFISTFVKAEKIDFSKKIDPAPRVIQPRSPRFNARIGPYIKAMEGKIYKAMGRLYEFPCVAKGFTSYQLGELFAKKWSLFKQPVSIGLDASRFDQHVSVAALKWTHSVYRRFNRDPEFCQLLDRLLRNKGFANAKDARFAYSVRGRRMSGDMDTALGNCVIMVAMCYSLCKKLNIRHELMNNGDDVNLILEGKDEPVLREAIPGWFADLGFKMKVEETVHRLEDVEFCQGKPVFDGHSWRMMRSPDALGKDLVSLIQVSDLPAWYTAIGQGGLALSAGMPIMQEFYSWMLRVGGPIKNMQDNHWFQSQLFLMGFDPSVTRVEEARRRPVSLSSRLSYWRAFGIDPQMQLLIEERYSQLDGPREGSDRILQVDLLRTAPDNYGSAFLSFSKIPWSAASESFSATTPQLSSECSSGPDPPTIPTCIAPRPSTWAPSARSQLLKSRPCRHPDSTFCGRDLRLVSSHCGLRSRAPPLPHSQCGAPVVDHSWSRGSVGGAYLGLDWVDGASFRTVGVSPRP